MYADFKSESLLQKLFYKERSKGNFLRKNLKTNEQYY